MSAAVVSMGGGGADVPPGAPLPSLLFGAFNQFTIATAEGGEPLRSACTSMAALFLKRLFDADGGHFDVDIDDVLSVARGVHAAILADAHEAMDAAGIERHEALANRDVLASEAFSDEFHIVGEENRTLGEGEFERVLALLDKAGGDMGCLFAHSGETMAIAVKHHPDKKRFYLFDSHGKSALGNPAAYVGTFESLDECLATLHRAKPPIEIDDDVADLGIGAFGDPNATNVSFVSKVAMPMPVVEAPAMEAPVVTASTESPEYYHAFFLPARNQLERIEKGLGDRVVRQFVSEAKLTGHMDRVQNPRLPSERMMHDAKTADNQIWRPALLRRKMFDALIASSGRAELATAGEISREKLSATLESLAPHK